jgi:gluconolactonase
MFALPQEIPTSVFASVPDDLRKKGPRPAWYDERPHAATHSFLEGPAFDRDGYLYCVDMPYGRIFRISPQGVFSVVADYDGEPNGLRIHKDGRIFIADRRYGVMVMEPGNSAPPKPLLDPSVIRGFRGLNDLTFAGNGDLYFTDQGETGLHDPAGSLYRLRANGKLEQILTNLPGPNGLALNADDSTLYLNMSRTNTIWSVPLHTDGRVHRVGIFIYLSGSTGGPDGLAPDAEGGLAVAHSGLGTVWLFSKVGEPTHRIRSCAGTRTTNLAYGGPDRKTLFITESHTGNILQASVPVPGRPLFSHA